MRTSKVGLHPISLISQSVHSKNVNCTPWKKINAIKLLTEKTMSETVDALWAAVQLNHFTVMQVHKFNKTINMEGVEPSHECLVFEVCQVPQVMQMPDENISSFTALPYLISINEKGGKTILATLKPTDLLAIFHTPKLKKVAKEVEDSMVKIMQEAAEGGFASRPEWGAEFLTPSHNQHSTIKETTC